MTEKHIAQTILTPSNSFCNAKYFDETPKTYSTHAGKRRSKLFAYTMQTCSPATTLNTHSLIYVAVRNIASKLKTMHFHYVMNTKTCC